MVCMHVCSTIYGVVLRLLLWVGVVGCMVSCSAHHDEVESPSPGQLNNIYLSLSISVHGNHSYTRAGETRAPMGGEDGNGRVDASANENRISNLTLLFYQPGDDGLNTSSAAGVPIKYAYYFAGLDNLSSTEGEERVDLVYSYKFPLYGTIDEGTYHVITIANAGDMTFLKGESLAEVRDRQLTGNLWTAATPVYQCNNFVMSSEQDDVVGLTANEQVDGTYDNPFEGTLTIERVAARVDLNVEGGTRKVASDNSVYYEYPVKDEVGNDTGDRVRLTGITVGNVLVPGATDGCYLLKRACDVSRLPESLTEISQLPVSYLADEEKQQHATTGKIEGTNLVIDPFFVAKKSGTGLTAHYTSVEADLAVDRQTDVLNGVTETYLTLAYVRENTLPVGCQKAAYATKLIFHYDYYRAGAGEPTQEGLTIDYYLRHCDDSNDYDDGTTDHPMKYGIVRNTIYRVKIGKITQMEPPGEETTVTLTPTIRVKKWNVVAYKEPVWM
ncbi:MAG: fimbria major subunit [Bacteroidaceae bacterium]|nr:fimbria major subunit [Bacteroidaceae bacterium]